MASFFFGHEGNMEIGAIEIYLAIYIYIYMVMTSKKCIANLLPI